ncbi:MAG: exo-alpha-sialidase [Phycisphaerae bacterium]|nr:exo-alpha-sialidase [Phycisphaerae bacterium]
MMITFALWLVAAVVAATADAPAYGAELIFPLEQKHNHSSCVVKAPDKSLLVCWYRGSGERSADDVAIMGARKQPGKPGWCPRFVMADTPNYPDCNPIMHVDGKGRLWLIWPTILDNHWESALLKYRLSSDWVSPDKPPVWSWQGVLHITPKDLGERLDAALKQMPDFVQQALGKWYKPTVEKFPQKLYHRLGWMPRVHATRLPGGKWILPLYCDTFSISIMAITADDGQTWQISEPLIGWGNIQPSVVQRKDGSLVAMMRENGVTKQIRVSESKDEGLTWGPVFSSPLPNEGSSVEVIKLASGHWALIYNDTKKGRHKLALSLSDDEGKTWKWTRHIERVPFGKGSFSYPSILQDADGMMHATYTYSIPEGKSIKYVRFNEAWVRQGDPKKDE